MLNIQERVPATIQNPNADEKILFNDATDGKLKTKDSSGVIEELSVDLTGVPTGGATGEVLAKASATDGDVEWIDPTGGVKEYVALLTQTGTNPPVATVLKNTLGGTVVWSYNVAGDYIATLSGAFAGNVWAIMSNPKPSSPSGELSGLSKIDNNSVNLILSGGDDILADCSIRIEVYP